MKRLLVVTLLTLVALAALLPASTSRAGDVIDFLPEVQTARSFSAVVPPGLTFQFAVFPDSRTCLQNNWPSDIPNHLLYDDNGRFHTIDEILLIVANIRCLFQVADGEANVVGDGFSILYSLESLKGEVVELSNGNILDGTKQSIRAVSIWAAAAGLTSVLLDGDNATSLFTDEAIGGCELLERLVLEGETIELRFATLFVLFGDIALQIEEDFGGRCLSERTESTEALVELTKSGEIEAAANLTYRLLNEVAAQFDADLEQYGDEAELEELQAVVDTTLTELGIEILENTERFPLLTMAVALSSLQIHTVDIVIELIEAFDLSSNIY